MKIMCPKGIPFFVKIHTGAIKLHLRISKRRIQEKRGGGKKGSFDVS